MVTESELSVDIFVNMGLSTSSLLNVKLISKKRTENLRNKQALSQALLCKQPKSFLIRTIVPCQASYTSEQPLYFDVMPKIKSSPTVKNRLRHGFGKLQ